jgi:hypothetical protein
MGVPPSRDIICLELPIEGFEGRERGAIAGGRDA